MVQAVGLLSRERVGGQMIRALRCGRRTLGASAVLAAVMATATPVDAAPTGSGRSTVNATTTTNNQQSYKVKAGDSLWSIAERSSVTMNALMRLNKLNVSSVIIPGQILALPPATLAKSANAVTVSGPRITIAKVVGRQSASLPGDLRVSTSAGSLVPLFRQAAAEAGVPADLLMSLSYTESRWQMSRVSSDGAVGIGQLMPDTALWVARTLVGDSSLDRRVAADNVRMSAYYLRYLIDLFNGDVSSALSSYFQGFASVQAFGPSRQGQAYANGILQRRASFSRL